jgi:GntR family transcriptional regulator, vanillate catabolism transcriptional regulator
MHVVPRGDAARSQTTKATLGLRELVFAGELAPGRRVPEVGLAERLGVSRTPLRLALATLAHEGLLRPLPGGGFVVCSFTLDDVADAIELRGVLEGTAARFAAERLESPSELADLATVTAKLDIVVGRRTPDLERFVELNDEYHRVLVALAKSDTVVRAIANVVALPFASPGALLASQATLTREREILVVAQHQHRMLLEAVRDGHGTRAEDIAREHARLAKLNLELVLESEPALERLPGAPLLRRVV